MTPDPSCELWQEAYDRFESTDAKLLEDFEGVIHKNNPSGRKIRLGSEQTQQQLVAFISEKMRASQQQVSRYPAFQRIVKALATPKDIVMTASAASPPVNAALAGMFLAFSMVQMYSSGKSAMSKTAYRLAKVFIRRKAACDRVHVQSDNEQKRLKALRESLRNTYVDLYHAMLKATAKLVCSLDDGRWGQRFLRRITLTFSWEEWETIHADLGNLEHDIIIDEGEIKDYGIMGPQIAAAVSAPSSVQPVTATSVRRGRNELHTAAISDDLPKVINLLQNRRFDINARTKHEWTALSLAAEKGFLDVVKVLLSAPGVDVDAQNGRGDTAVHVVAINQKLPEKRRVQMIKLLTIHGAKVDVRNHGGRTAFLDAAKNGSLRVVQVLKKTGAGLDQVTEVNGWSALHEASGNSHIELVKWLLSRKVDTKIKAKAGNNRDKTAVEVARKWGNKETDAEKKGRFEEIVRLIDAVDAVGAVAKAK